MRLAAITFGALLLGLPMSPVLAQTLTPNTITVTGSATIHTPPDTVTITVNLNATDKSAAAALQANKDMAAQLRQLLRPFNIAAAQIQLSNVNVNYQRGPANQTPPTGSYQVSTRMGIALDDISRLPAVLDAIAGSGSAVSVSEQYGLKDRSALEDRARAQALANARHQAEALAAAQGAKLDKMIAISTAMAPGNYLNTLNLGVLNLPLQDGQIAVTQQVVVEYGLQ